ncbi:hypothetical protein B296_00013204, partial [Ensete ventricosum]
NRVELGESESVGKGNEKMSGTCRANGVAAPIPTGSRKLVQSLREIVHCPEPEIYAMLRECNMDPNEAVHRLLGQDTFHEVKSKRDKKKENPGLEQLMAVQVVGLGLALTVVPVGLLPNLVLLLNHSGQWFELNEVDRLVSPLGSGHDRAPPRRAPSVPLYYSPRATRWLLGPRSSTLAEATIFVGMLVVTTMRVIPRMASNLVSMSLVMERSWMGLETTLWRR